MLTMKSVLFTLASLVVVSVVAYKEEKDVLVLDASSFDDAIGEFDPLLVEFYAPWCGHCKRLEPEYAQAAGVLKEDGIRIAKVDATENRDLATKYGVQGFPTLKFFRGGKATEYGGGRTKDTIVSWVKKRSGPPARVLATAEDAEEFSGSAKVVVIGYFADAESAEAKAFLGAASQVDSVEFGIVSDAAAFGKEAEGSIVLFKQFDEGRANFAGDATSPAEIAKFVQDNQLPLVIPFTNESAEQIFGGSVKTHFLLFADSTADGYEALIEQYTALAKPNRGKLLFITVGTDQAQVMKYFELSEEDLPTAFIVNMSEGGMKKFAFPGDELTGDSLSGFVADYLAGDLSPSLKSEEPEEDDLTQDVAVLRGKTFEKVALDETKDVLVEFYAPWCGHCKKLAPTYEKLGAKFADVDSVVIAKMDATANEIDVEGVSVSGFPTLYFFPGKAGAEPKLYDGARSLDGFVEYIEKNAATSFNLAAGEADEEDDGDL